MNIHTVRAEPLSSAGFAPFGQVVGLDELVIEAKDGETLHLDILSKSYQPLDVTSFNRHFKATQAQIALDGKPSVILVAPASIDLDKPEDIESVRAFVCDGSIGYNLKIGTWHAGAYPLMDSVRLVNLQGRRPDVDIEIRDIAKILDTTIQVRL
jgi:ureidoglycolate hydrolase